MAIETRKRTIRAVTKIREEQRHAFTKTSEIRGETPDSNSMAHGKEAFFART
jgi:hypothetical protein